MDVLEEILLRLATNWPRKQKDALRELAARYLSGDESDALVAEIRAIRPQEHPLDTSGSYVIVATWLINRAGRFAQRLKAGVLATEDQPEFPPPNMFDGCAIESVG